MAATTCILCTRIAEQEEIAATRHQSCAHEKGKGFLLITPSSARPIAGSQGTFGDANSLPLHSRHVGSARDGGARGTNVATHNHEEPLDTDEMAVG